MSIKNFPGSIELISGITPKNDGDFPLVNAKDIIVYEDEFDTTGTRLPQKLKEAGVSDEEKEKIVDSVFTNQKFVDVANDAYTNKTNIEALEADLLENNKNLKVEYLQDKSTLYLYEGSQLIIPGEDNDFQGNVLGSTIIEGGGGGSTLGYELSMERIGEREVSYLQSEPKIAVQYRANFVNVTTKEPEPNKITFKASVDGQVIKTWEEPGNVIKELDVTQYMKKGDNAVRIVASYSEIVDDEKVELTPAILNWNVKIIELQVSSLYDDSLETNANRETAVPITVQGDITKTLHWIIDGNTDTIYKYENIVQPNFEYNITLPAQTHGSHSLEVYASAIVNDVDVKSESLHFDIMRIAAGNSTPIIRAVPMTKIREQYTTIPIEYSVYQENTSSSTVELKVISENEVQKTNENGIPIEGEFETVITQEFYSKLDRVGREEQTWYYSPLTDGKKTLTITCGETVKTLEFNISKFPHTITPVLNGLELDFDPTGRTNQDSDYNEFTYNDVTWTLSDNFNWKQGGWQTDENNATYFCIKAGTSMTLNYNLFEDPSLVSKNGAEFKIVFKTTNVANPNATWLSCLADTEKGESVGLQMDVHNGHIYSNLQSLKIPYSEEDVIEFDMNITPFGQSDEKNIPMIMTYEDGTPVQPVVLTDTSTSFTQLVPAPITIGSEDCDIHIYRIKAYSNFLTEKQILSNFIADATTGSEKANRYLRNQIYDDLLGLTPESVAEACPDLRVIKITAPRFTKGKLPEVGWDKVSDTTIEMIYKNGGPEQNWVAKYCQHTGQGTSSNAYGQAGRNIDLIMNKSGVDGYKPEIRIDGGKGKIVKKVPLSPTSVPANYFNIKVNIASSENANNALLQKRYDRYLPYSTGTDVRDPLAKTTMEFFNCVIFVKETGENTLKGSTESPVEFDDSSLSEPKFHFYGIGNIGDSKKTDESRTSDPDDTNEFCVEIMDWNKVLSTFPLDTKVVASKYNETDLEGKVVSYTFISEENLGKTEEDAEPKLYEKQADGSYTLTQDIEIDYDNIDKYYVDILENDDFSEDYTYGFRYLVDDEDPEQVAAAKAKWIEFYRYLTRDLTTNGVDDPEKVAAWKAEFDDWFIKDAAFYYYLYTLRYTMVDNRAKNSFWHYSKVATTNEDGQLVYATDENGDYIYKFDFWDYDNDTSLGIDNMGKLEMDYGVEDNDLDPTVGGGDIEQSPTFFRGASSTFFQRLVKYFGDEINTSYSTFESKNLSVFDSTHLINEFDTWQSQFPEELWRLDYERKYKRPYVNGGGSAWDNAIAWDSGPDLRFLRDMMNGKKKYQRRQFERNQDFYMSSKFIGMRNSSDQIMLRGAGDLSGATGLAVPQDTTLYVTPYMNMYINLNSNPSGGTPYARGIRVNAGETRAFPYDPAAASFEFNFIYGASKIQSLGDLSKMYLQTATLGKGAKLKEIILGNETVGYANDNLKELEITENNAILEILNVENIASLTGSAPVESSANLKKFYAKGTGFTGVTFAPGGLINYAELPATLNTLRLKDLFFLTDANLTLEGYNNIFELVIDNTLGVDELSFVQKCPALGRIRLTNVDWTGDRSLADATLLNKLAKCKGVGDDGKTPVDSPVLTGSVYVQSLKESEFELFETLWPGVVKYPEGSLIPQHKLRFWRDKTDEKPIYEILVDHPYYLDESIDPSAALIEQGLLVKPATAEYKYTFENWDSTWENTLGQLVVKDMDFEAVFSAEKQKYTVSWHTDTSANSPVISNEAGEQAMVVVEYGQAAYFDETKFANPVRATDQYTYHLFGGWDKSTGKIVGNTQVFPVWKSANIDDPGDVPSLNLSAEKIYALSHLGVSDNVNSPTVFEKAIADGSQITVQLGYMPDYDGIVLIDSDRVFDGTKASGMVTDYMLFDEDKSFTLAIDFTMGYNNKSDSTDNVLMSCGSGAASASNRGVRLFSSINNEIPKVHWNYSKSQAVAFNAPTKDRQYRNIFVLRHIKGDPNLYVYVNNRYSLDPVAMHTLEDVATSTLTHKLSFGGQSSSAGTLSNYGIGTIHYAKLWFDDLGDAECKKICSWIYDDITFTRCASSMYYLKDSEDKSALSFVADKLLDNDYFFDTQQNTKTYSGGWDVSQMRTWLNSKVLAGLSITWQQVLQPIELRSLYGYSTATTSPVDNSIVNTTEDKLYIPAYSEISKNASNDDTYKKESSSNIIYSNFAESDTNTTPFVKYYPHGKAGYWWTRTPLKDEKDKQVVAQPDNGIGEGWDQTQNPDGSYNYRNFYKYDGEPGVNNNATGVLLAFSIGEA